METALGADAPRTVGRYALFGPIASGGMATVHFGRLRGQAGFSRVVAIKRLHPHLAASAEFVSGFLDEAHLAARVRHPNVVSVLDVFAEASEILLVMDYVVGEALSSLADAARGPIAASIAASIVAGALHGLHAAHEACGEGGEPLGIVHRDVSPHNILVGVDGIARVVDFGIAKASGRIQETRAGQIKGKIAYMSPEQALAGDVTRATDVFAAAIVLWQLLAGRRLYDSENEAQLVGQVLEAQHRPPSEFCKDVPPALDAAVMRALAREPARRYPTAREFALALEEAVKLAPAWAVGEWVESLAKDALARRARELGTIEKVPLDGEGTPSGALPAALVAPSRAVPDGGTVTDAEVAIRPEAARPRAPKSRTRRRVVVGAVVAAAVAFVALGGATLALKARGGGARLGAGANAAPSSASASEEPPAPSRAPPASSASAFPVAPSPTRVVARPPQRVPKRPVKAGGKRAPPSCDPPYVEDSAGIRYPKPECL